MAGPSTWATVAMISKALEDLDAFGSSALRVKIAQAFCNWADFAVTYLAIVELCDGGEFTHRSRAKHLIGTVNIDN
jgi:hypothetical protein